MQSLRTKLFVFYSYPTPSPHSSPAGVLMKKRASGRSSSQAKDNPRITLPSVHSHSSALARRLFYYNICICQLLFVKTVYSETI